MKMSALRGTDTAILRTVEWWLFRCAWQLTRIPLSALAAGLLVAGGLVVWIGLVPRAAAELERAEQQLSARRTHLAAEMPVATGSPRIVDLVETSINRTLVGSDIFSAFGAHGARVEQVDLGKETPVSGAERVQTVKIHASVVGPYPALKEGLRELLKQHPTLALEVVVLSKGTTSDKGVTADLTMVLWYEGDQ